MFSVELGDEREAFVKVHLCVMGVESKTDQDLRCAFRRDAVDLQIPDLKGQAWRFFRDDLQHDIVPDLCSFYIRKNHVVLCLRKKRRESGYEGWTDLLALGRPKRKRTEEAEATEPDDEVKNFLGHLHHHGDDDLKMRVGQWVAMAREALSRP